MGSPGWKASIFKWRKPCHDRLIRPKWTGKASQRLLPSRYQVSVLVLSSAQQAGWSVASQLSPLQLASTASLGINTQHPRCHQPPTPSSINPSFCSRYTLFPRPSPPSISLTPIRAQLLKWAQCAHFGPTCTSASSRIAGLSVLLTRQQSHPPLFGHHHYHSYCNTLIVLVHFCIRFY